MQQEQQEQQEQQPQQQDQAQPDTGNHVEYVPTPGESAFTAADQAISMDGESSVSELGNQITSGNMPRTVEFYSGDRNAPEVFTSDEDTIVRAYNGLVAMTVGQEATPGDNTYNAAVFVLSNGDIARFEFAGRDTIKLGDKYYLIENANDFWNVFQGTLDIEMEE